MRRNGNAIQVDALMRISEEPFSEKYSAAIT